MAVNSIGGAGSELRDLIRCERGRRRQGVPGSIDMSCPTRIGAGGRTDECDLVLGADDVLRLAE